MKLSFPRSIYARLMLGLALLQCIAVIVLQVTAASELIPYIKTNDKSNQLRPLPVYVVIFVGSQIVSVALSWDAVFHQNTIQLIGFVIYNFCTFGYALFQLGQRELSRDTISQTTPLSTTQIENFHRIFIAIPVVIGVFSLIFVYLAYKLYLEFGWRIYKKIGADPHMKNMYRAYQVFLMLLKIDVFFFLSYSIQYLVLVLDKQDYEFPLTIAALPFTALILVASVYGLKREDKRIMLGFIFGCVLGAAYFIFKLVRMYTNFQLPDGSDKYAGTRNFLTFFSALSLLMVILTLINSVVCYNNFGKGLKQHISNVKQPNPETGDANKDRKIQVE